MREAGVTTHIHPCSEGKDQLNVADFQVRLAQVLPDMRGVDRDELWRFLVGDGALSVVRLDYDTWTHRGAMMLRQGEVKHEAAQSGEKEAVGALFERIAEAIIQEGLDIPTSFNRFSG